MKDLNLIVWLTQLGMSVAIPLAAFVLLGVWLHNGLGWGVWTVWVGIGLGVISAINGFRSSLQVLASIAKGKKEKQPPAVSFNDHD